MKKFSRINQYDSALFDSFRGASALLVLIGHMYQFIVAPSYQLDIENNVASFFFSQMAVLSVMVFFVLSGFMITASMYRNISERNFMSFDVPSFAKDRLIRLYPPLLFTLLLMVLLYLIAFFIEPQVLINFSSGKELYLVREKLELDVLNVVASLFFLQNFFDLLSTPSMNSPLWSLSHEFWFYVLAAIALLSCYKKLFLIPLLTLLVIAAYCDNKVMFLAGFCIWLSGAILALLYFNDFLTLPKVRYAMLTIFILLFFIYCFFVINRSSHFFLHGSKFIFGLLFTSFLSLLISFELHANERFMKNKLMLFFKDSAKYSYTLYLIHAPILLFSLALLNESILFKPSLYLGLSVVLVIIITGISKYLANYLENKHYILGVISNQRENNKQVR